MSDAMPPDVKRFMDYMESSLVSTLDTMLFAPTEDAIRQWLNAYANLVTGGRARVMEVPTFLKERTDGTYLYHIDYDDRYTVSLVVTPKNYLCETQQIGF